MLYFPALVVTAITIQKCINFADCALTACQHAGVVPSEDQETAHTLTESVEYDNVQFQTSLELSDVPPTDRPQSGPSQQATATEQASLSIRY